MNTHNSWLWPDRFIGKRESRQLRNEHNATVNSHEDLLTALEELVGSIESDPRHIRCSIPVVNEARKAAIEKANAALSKALRVLARKPQQNGRNIL